MGQIELTWWRDTQAASRQSVYLALFLLAYAWIAWSVVQEFFEPPTGDFTHEIYFGQRVLLGDLPWTREYFEKLPASQILMAVPSFFGGITAWRAISLAMSILASLVVLAKFPGIISRQMGISASAAHQAAHVMVLGYFSLMTIIPGGFTSMNSISASLTIAGTLALLATLDNRQSSLPWLTLAVCGLAFALAISIRPYFFSVFVVVVLWVGLSSVGLKNRSFSAFAANPGLALLLSTGAFGLLFNLGPFVFLGELQAFFDGLAAMGGATRPPFTLKASLFLGLASLFAGLTGYFCWRKKIFIGTLFSLSAVALTAIILSQHFWNHYVAFYAWYFSGLGAILLLSWLQKSGSLGANHYLEWTPKKKIASSLLVLAVGVTSMSFGYTVPDSPPARNLDYVRNVTWLVENFGRENVSFVAPREMYAHWVFAESRKGLPGGQALSPIKDGAWQSKGRFESFQLPRTIEEYCKIIHTSGTRFLLVRSYHLPDSCFVSPGGQRWVKLAAPPGPSWSVDVDVWENPRWR